MDFVLQPWHVYLLILVRAAGHVKPELAAVAQAETADPFSEHPTEASPDDGRLGIKPYRKGHRIGQIQAGGVAAVDVGLAAVEPQRITLALAEGDVRHIVDDLSVVAVTAPILDLLARTFLECVVRDESLLGSRRTAQDTCRNQDQSRDCVAGFADRSVVYFL